MKKTFLLVSVILILSFSAANADFCIRVKEARDAHYHHGSLEPAEDSEGEIWFGDNRIAMTHDDRRYIMDIEAGKFIIVELNDSIYVETAMPLKLADVVAEEQVPRLAMFPTVGEIEKLDETREIKGRKCRGHLVKTWVMYKGTRYNERESEVWTTDDIPVDPELVRTFNRNMINLRNMSEEMAAGLMEIEGLNMLSKSVEYSEGTRINSSAEAIMCREMDPDGDPYSIPEGFTKQDRLPPRRR